MWILKNSKQLLENLQSQSSHINSIRTFDFSTLYTTIPHDKLKSRLCNIKVKALLLTLIFTLEMKKLCTLYTLLGMFFYSSVRVRSLVYFPGRYIYLHYEQSINTLKRT